MFIKKILFFLILFSISTLEIKAQKKNASVKKNNASKKLSQNSIENKEKKDIYLNFENTELSNFVNYIAELKNINLIPDDKLKGQKVSLTIREPLSVNGAWNVFLTVLEMGGFSIIKKGDVQVIIPKAQKAKQPLPAYLNVPISQLPDNDLNLRYVTFLQNISVNDIQGILKGMLSPESVVVPYPQVNGLIITDKSYNIKSAMKVINELDQTGLQESVVVMRLKRANAQDIKELFDNLIKKPEGNPLARLLGRQAESNLEYFSPTTRIIAEERTNSLILLGNRKSIEKIEDFVINNLDTELKAVESPLHIYELQNTEVEQIKSILETVTEPSGEKSKYGAVRGGVKYFKKMNFQADKDGNRLIVSSTDIQDWKLLKKTIKDLDKPQPQVALETLIVSVDFVDNKEFGGAIRNKREGQIGKGVNAQSPSPGGIQQKKNDNNKIENNLLGNMLSGFTGEIGSTLLSIGSKTNVWAAFKALKSMTNTTVLSQPFFTTANKTLASIDIGTERQVVVQESGSNIGYETQAASTKIDITPQINLDGIIRLNIKMKISEFQSATGSSGDKYKKDLDTDVSVADGQVLVLGGFIKTKVSENTIKTPFLGDIPLLGWLFKNKERKITKSYLFVFLSPTIIKPRQKPGANLYTRMKLHQATDNIGDAIETRKTNDPVHNWFFNPDEENYSHKVVDFANARYQPTTVDIKNDPYYRSETENILKEKKRHNLEKISENNNIENKILEQKRKELKNLISSKPIIKAETTIKKKLSTNNNSPSNFPQKINLNSEKPTIIQKNSIESKKLKLKKMLQSNPKITQNIKENLKKKTKQNKKNKKRKRKKRKTNKLRVRKSA